jgi:hypothetical protein
MLAVALDPNQEQNAKIEIYRATQDESTMFAPLHAIDNLSTAIEFIDFSTDNYFLVYKDNFEEVANVDLSNLSKRNLADMEFDIDW